MEGMGLNPDDVDDPSEMNVGPHYKLLALFIVLALLKPLLTLTLFYFGYLEHEEFKSIAHDWLWEL